VERVKYPLSGQSKRYARNIGNDLVTRQHQEIADKLENERFFYAADVEIGTPPQRLNLLLDTGSSDTWAYTPQSQTQQQPLSVFDPSKSRSFHSNGTSFKIEYGIGSVQGSWGTDKFQIGNALVKGLSIGIADSGTTQQGIIGIGRPQAEITYKSGHMYENLPMKLAAEGIINTAAYSLYLDDINAESGTILFGGVDRSKFDGQLAVLPISHPQHLGITLQNMRTDGRVQNPLMTAPKVAVLDSGTSLSYFSSDVMQNLHEALNANPSFAIGEKYYCDCNVTDNLVLDFGSAAIAVPNYQFLWPIETIVNPVLATAVFPPNSCYIGIETIQRNMDFYLIGDDFLRSFYTVYDIQDSRIAIAQVKNDGGQPQIEAIRRDFIPGS
jgi:hypothetical protein